MNHPLLGRAQPATLGEDTTGEFQAEPGAALLHLWRPVIETVLMSLGPQGLPSLVVAGEALMALPRDRN